MHPHHTTYDRPEVREAVSDLSLAVQRALLRIHQHNSARIALPHGFAVGGLDCTIPPHVVSNHLAAPNVIYSGATGPTGPTGSRAA